jgi:nucleoside phosphorylase
MRILFVAADPREYRGMLAHASEVRREKLPIDFAQSGRFGGVHALLAANGAGWQRAAAAVDAAGEFRPEAIVSTGFCGALDETYGIGDVVVGTAVLGGGREHPSVPLPAAGARQGVICSIDHVAGTAEEKRQLRKSGASAVEMEAAGVANSAEKRGIPFYCVRVVTDLAGETLANDFNRALRPDGHFDTMFILRGALCRPAARLPELLRLRNRCARAAQVLGEFLVGCRF